MVITHRPAAPQSEADPSAGDPAPRLPPPPRPQPGRARPLLRPRAPRAALPPGSAAVTAARGPKPGLLLRSPAVVAVRAAAAGSAVKGSLASPRPTQIQLRLALKGEACGGVRRSKGAPRKPGHRTPSSASD